MEKFQANNIFPLLSDAIEFIEKNKSNGCICPCCNQIIKVYKRALNSVMSRCLIRLYVIDKNNNKYHHVKKIVSGISDTGTNDFSKLKYYGFIEEQPKDSSNTKTRTSGFWRITEKGRLFVENKTSAESHIYLCNASLLGFSETKTSIIESLGKKFNYNELMSIKIQNGNIRFIYTEENVDNKEL